MNKNKLASSALPFFVVSKSSPQSASGRCIRLTSYNEKHLVLLLLIISMVTLWMILVNLPEDLQRAVNRDMQNVFLPPQSHNLNVHRADEPPQPPVSPGLKIEITPLVKQTTQIENARSTNKTLSINEKREKIRQMTLLAWSSYEKYAWGENELKPLSRTGHSAGIFGSTPTRLGATIVDGLDTMYLMGFLSEYERGRDWILKNLNLNVDTDYSAFEVNIRFIGGLLSIYTLTKDARFLEKADEIATLLLPIFDTPNGIPYALVNPKTKKVKNYNWVSGSCSILAEFGTLSLEFQYLSDHTKKPIFAEKVKRIYETLGKVEKENGLYYNYLSSQTGKWCMKHASMGALGDSFYEYLLKLWVYTGKTDQHLLNTYVAAMSAVQTQMVQVSSSGSLVYIGEMKSGRVEKKMDHLACFSGGLFALSSVATNGKLSKDVRDQYLQLAVNITNTCHESYMRTPTHLGPESFHFERVDNEAMSIKQNEKYYILRPEVVESYFYLWRITKDPKYRDWAWDFVLALEKHCKSENGYSGVKDVYDPNAVQDDVQQSFFFAETLKYLFLIFSNDDVLSLDKFVFNTEAHPFLIRT